MSIIMLSEQKIWQAGGSFEARKLFYVAHYSFPIVLLLLDLEIKILQYRDIYGSMERCFQRPIVFESWTDFAKKNPTELNEDKKYLSQH